MIRPVAALAAALFLIAAPVAAVAADHPVVLTLDGRRVDRQGGVALAHNGVVYADIVDLVKSFDGLLTFQGAGNASVHVTIGSNEAVFTLGSKTMMLGQGSVQMAGRPFLHDGDMFVPLNAFITRVASATVNVNPAQSRADIRVNANPL